MSSTPALDASGGSSALSAWALDAASRTAGFGRDLDRTLRWCVEVGARAPHVGAGRTRELWDLMAAVAALDVSAARMLEPHLDALTILAQAGARPLDADDGSDLGQIGVTPGSTWGVFAAEGAGTVLRADVRGGEWRLNGTKPWCSLAGTLTHALVTASAGTDRRLFAVDLRSAGVRAHAGPWFARGLPAIVSADVDFDDVVASPIGGPGWYLSRPGFAWGGMTVAACWWGGAVGVAGPIADAARSERADQLALVHLGRVDAALWAARAVLDEAAQLLDSGRSAGVGDRLLASRVRAAVTDAATLVLAQADAALGPGPLVSDDAHAGRVADLHLYLRQHHGLRDAARLGRDLAGTASG